MIKQSMSTRGRFSDLIVFLVCLVQNKNEHFPNVHRYTSPCAEYTKRTSISICALVSNLTQSFCRSCTTKRSNGLLWKTAMLVLFNWPWRFQWIVENQSLVIQSFCIILMMISCMELEIDVCYFCSSSCSWKFAMIFLKICDILLF